MGVSGGLVQMIAHGFVSAAMFLSHWRAVRPRALA
jgi:NADH:ubiquinone oxidoreductase subunit 4 (subunit M)